ncbi:MAG: hypothetical protein WCG55_03040 [bacterium]
MASIASMRNVFAKNKSNVDKISAILNDFSISSEGISLVQVLFRIADEFYKQKFYTESEGKPVSLRLLDEFTFEEKIQIVILIKGSVPVDDEGYVNSLFKEIYNIVCDAVSDWNKREF